MNKIKRMKMPRINLTYSPVTVEFITDITPSLIGLRCVFLHPTEVQDNICVGLINSMVDDIVLVGYEGERGLSVPVENILGAIKLG